MNDTDTLNTPPLERDDFGVPTWALGSLNAACDHCWHSEGMEFVQSRTRSATETCCRCGADRGRVNTWVDDNGEHGPFVSLGHYETTYSDVRRQVPLRKYVVYHEEGEEYGGHLHWTEEREIEEEHDGTRYTSKVLRFPEEAFLDRIKQTTVLTQRGDGRLLAWGIPVTFESGTEAFEARLRMQVAP